MTKINRRYFFGKVSIGAIGAIILSKLPVVQFFKKKSKIKSEIKISQNPNSVKRIK